MLSAIAHGEGTKKEPSARTGLRPAPDPAAALAAERQELMNDPAFLDAKNPEHKEVLARYREVTQKMYGERG